ncbi:hypothetical protein Ddye_021517 [Dipteronia dyeriana]|uniref:Legume lectin domain-containing protein n=1 Tax=Dipteronia dyeriana TaxID=168575 RepID=A0AAD9WXT0_9ROSI|nr:hypothetical protein Ddye_021517 [Dipteronia dyeriana]
MGEKNGLLHNSFGTITDGTNDSCLDSSVVRLTNDSNQFSFGRAYHPQKLTMKPNSNSTTLSSFSTSFVFSVLPEIVSSPSFGICFVLTNFTSFGQRSLQARRFSSSLQLRSLSKPLTAA